MVDSRVVYNFSTVYKDRSSMCLPVILYRRGRTEKVMEDCLEAILLYQKYYKINGKTKSKQY